VSAGMSPFTFHLFSVPLITFVWGLKLFRHSTAKGILAQASHCASALRRHEAPPSATIIPTQIVSQIASAWGLAMSGLRCPNCYQPTLEGVWIMDNKQCIWRCTTCLFSGIGRIPARAPAMTEQFANNDTFRYP